MAGNAAGRFQIPPLMIGDPVVVTVGSAEHRGRIEQIQDHAASSRGHRYRIRMKKTGESRWFPRSQVRFYASKKRIAWQAAVIRRSWFDAELRKELGLPSSRALGVNGGEVLEAVDEDEYQDADDLD